MERIYERIANLERDVAYYDLNLVVIRKRLEKIEGSVEYLKSELVAPDVNLIQLRLRIKEIEERLGKTRSVLKDYFPDKDL